ncbi:unnamed protein product [Moneuplotes crassus]|uniref:Uncharacterized protein n=1 Tax=Euplotes crassus TaxID=5936 RepID=A0AAD1UNK6_EUPCR|nr:unnamed protein product [Moneuplotes crassus]
MESKKTLDPRLLSAIQDKLLMKLFKHKKITFKNEVPQRRSKRVEFESQKKSKTFYRDKAKDLIERYSGMNTEDSKYYLVKVNVRMNRNIRSPGRQTRLLSPLKGQVRKRTLHKSPVTVRNFGVILNVKSNLACRYKRSQYKNKEESCRMRIGVENGRRRKQSEGQKKIQVKKFRRPLKLISYKRNRLQTPMETITEESKSMINSGKRLI